MQQRYRKLLPHATVLFLYGAAVHGLLFLRSPGRTFAPVHDGGEFVALPMEVAVVVFGGICTSLLLLGLLDGALSTEPPSALRILVEGGFRGVAATLLAVAASSLVGAAALTGHLISHPPPEMVRHLPRGVGLAAAPFLLLGALMDVSLYAMGPAVDALPLASLAGAAGAVYILVVSRFAAPTPRWEGRLLDRGTVCLVLGLLAVAFAVVPLVGLALGAAATVYGLWSGVWRRRARSRVMLGRVGTILGLAVVAFHFWGYIVYKVAARAAHHGW